MSHKVIDILNEGLTKKLVNDKGYIKTTIRILIKNGVIGLFKRIYYARAIVEST